MSVGFGLKLWGAAKSDGTLLYPEPSCGSNTRIIAEHGLARSLGDICLGKTLRI